QLWSHPAGTVRRQLPYTTSQQRSTLQPRALSVITGTDDGGRSGAIQVSTGRCLDVAGSGVTSGTPVQIWDCSGNKNQKWSLGKNGSIIGYGGNCLEAAGDFGANGRSIVMATCNGTQAQTWRIRGQIRSDLNNRCLDDSAGGTTNGARVQMWDCIGNANQTWEVQPS
ncbi:RICIN domain-containing protein, partial [Xanthomonas perforans]|nr:RICIN domain-containing protein [Xanthomonas perforans]